MRSYAPSVVPGSRPDPRESKCELRGVLITARCTRAMSPGIRYMIGIAVIAE